MTNYFFERYRPEIFRGLHKWFCERIIRRFGSFRAKKNFSKIWNFLTFFAYPGSQISWKMTNFFLRDTGLKFLWTAQMVLRTNFKVLLVFSREKKNFFENSRFFYFFAYPGSQISWKMTNFFFERYRPEICRGLHKWCCEQILRHLRLFRAKNFFFKNWKFFDFFCISWVTDFLKND